MPNAFELIESYIGAETVLSGKVYFSGICKFGGGTGKLLLIQILS